jgi:hypothetical protein
MAWLASLLHEAASFYRMQLHRHGEAIAYLHQRGVRSPELIEHMRIGYVTGGCLRSWLSRLGYPLHALRQAGLVTAAGYDAYLHRIVCFRWKAISTAAASRQGRRLTDSCRASRVACIYGSRSCIVRR